MIDQTRDLASLRRFAYWYWSQYLGVPVGADWSCQEGTCQCRNKHKCRRAGKHPIPAEVHLGPMFEPAKIRGEDNPKASPTAPHHYASREPWDHTEWVRNGWNPTAYPLAFLMFDVEGGGKDGAESTRRFCELYNLDPREITDTLTTNTGGGGKHHWLALPASWRPTPPAGVKPYDRFLPGVDLKFTAPGALDSKATLPGASHSSGGVYTFELTADGIIRDPVMAPDALLEAIVAGPRWEPVSRAERTEIEVAHLNAAGGRIPTELPEWRFARRFLGPGEASPPRSTFRDHHGSMWIPDLPADHFLNRCPS
jgi:hypothetical protein